jgi:tetratricopeptide (TPR) repeat protein
MAEPPSEFTSLHEGAGEVCDDARSQHLYAGVGELRRRRRVQRIGALALVGLAACAVFYARKVVHTPGLTIAGCDLALPPRAAQAHTVATGAAELSGLSVQREEAPRAGWRSLSQSGDYQGAYRLLANGTAVEDDSEALMDAADAARLSGHSEATLIYLQKLLQNHRDSPVAPLAAFTLGRVLLERLGEPAPAADAFALAVSLAPEGSLAQDALAREVEARSKAGHPDEAYECARLYVESYPQGPRLHAVQLYGGLQTR